MPEIVPPLAPVASPCVGVCLLDRVTGLCQGCLRTGAEIGEWRDADRPRHLEILRAVAVRRARRGARPALDARGRATDPDRHGR